MHQNDKKRYVLQYLLVLLLLIPPLTTSTSYHLLCPPSALPTTALLASTLPTPMLPTLCATRPPRCPPPHHLSLTPPTASIPCRIHLHITNLTHRLPPTPSLAHTAHLCHHLHGVHVHYRLHIQSPAPPTQPTARCGCLQHRARARTDCAPCTQTTHLPRISLRTPRMHTRPTPPLPTTRTAHVHALTALPHSDHPPPAHHAACTMHAHASTPPASRTGTR